jgi:hypothetical protein
MTDLTYRQQKFLESVLEKKLWPFWDYEVYIRGILANGYYSQDVKNQLNEFGKKYMERYFKHKTSIYVFHDGSGQQYTYYKEDVL